MSDKPLQKLKLAYITHTAFCPSETFLKHTLDGLAKAFDTVFICGESKPRLLVDTRAAFTGYHELPRVPHKTLVWGLSKCGPWGRRQAWRVRRRHAGKRVAPLLSGCDFALVEYGESAALVFETLARARIKFAVAFHGYDASALLGDTAYLELLTKIGRLASFFVVPSEHLNRRLVLAGITSKRTYVVPYDPQYQLIASLQPLECDNRLVVSLGRLTAKKSPMALLHVARLVLQELPDARFVFIGGGEAERDMLARAVRTEGLQDRIELAGALEHSRALSIVKRAAVFIQHSVTAPGGDQEGFPVAIAEAAALSKPIVSTVHSGIPENVIDGTTGLLVQEHDYPAMANAVLRLLRDKEMRAKFGSAGRERIMQLAPPGHRSRVLTQAIHASTKDNSTGFDDNADEKI